MSNISHKYGLSEQAKRTLSNLIPCRTEQDIIVEIKNNHRVVGIGFLLENQSANKRLIVDKYIVLEPGESMERRIDAPYIYTRLLSFKYVDAPTAKTIDNVRFFDGPRIYIEKYVPFGLDLSKY